jgi:tetratricopeptide (TPR) repeat protein
MFKSFLWAAVLIVFFSGCATSSGRLTSPEEYIGRPKGYADNKEYDKAIADYDRAIKLDPLSIGAFMGHGDAYCGKEDKHRGQVYRKKGEPELAEEDFAKALSLNADYETDVDGPTLQFQFLHY